MKSQRTKICAERTNLCDERFHSKFFCPFTLHRRNFKTQQSPFILDLNLRKTRSGKSDDYRDTIIFEKLPFQNVFHPQENEKLAFSNSFGLKSVFEKLHFRDGLVCTVEIKPRFQISLAYCGRCLTCRDCRARF